MGSFASDKEQRADKRYNELFGSSQSEFARTNPELHEIFKNHIYGDVWEIGDFSPKERKIIDVVVLASKGDTQTLGVHVKGALSAGATPEEITEVISQVAPYAGVGNSINALMVANKIFEEQGVKLPLKSQKTVDEKTRYQKGIDAQVAIFGERMLGLRDGMSEGQKHIADFLRGYCFGDFYTRDGVDLQFRELLTLVMLVAIGDTSSQMASHIRGNINMGNSKEKMVALITQASPFIGFPRTLNALNVLNEVTK